MSIDPSTLDSISEDPGTSLDAADSIGSTPDVSPSVQKSWSKLLAALETIHPDPSIPVVGDLSDVSYVTSLASPLPANYCFRIELVGRNLPARLRVCSVQICKVSQDSHDRTRVQSLQTMRNDVRGAPASEAFVATAKALDDLMKLGEQLGPFVDFLPFENAFGVCFRVKE